MTETAVAISGPDRRRADAARLGRAPDGRAPRSSSSTASCGSRGPQVMAGYLNAEAECLRADGWLQTGDLARIDADGNLFIVDRIKELIKVNAFQVAPAELEALLAHPPARRRRRRHRPPRRAHRRGAGGRSSCRAASSTRTR